MRSGSDVVQSYTAGELLEELLDCPKERRAMLLDDERFRSSALLDLLLEECHRSLPFDPVRGDEIGGAAMTLGRFFQDEDGTEPGMELERKCYACWLGATARRLLSDPREAETLLQQVAFLDVGRPARAIFCWEAKLLRWHQDRCEEAAALLHHAARRFREEWKLRDQGAFLALASLIALEQLSLTEAAELLPAGLRKLDGERHPWLAGAATLGLVLTRLERGDATNAVHTARGEARSLCKGIDQKEALLRLRWLEGRLAARLGELADAGRLLGSIQKECLRAGRLPEVTLATLDLGEVWAEIGRRAEIEPLVAELAANFASHPGLDLVLVTLEGFAAEAQAGPLDHTLWLCVGSAQRMFLSQQSVYFQPVPFA